MWDKERRWFEETVIFNTALLLNKSLLKDLIHTVGVFKQGRIINN